MTRIKMLNFIVAATAAYFPAIAYGGDVSFEAVSAWCAPRQEPQVNQDLDAAVRAAMEKDPDSVVLAFRRLAFTKDTDKFVRRNAIRGLAIFNKSEGRKLQEDILRNLISDLTEDGSPDIFVLQAATNSVCAWQDESMRAARILMDLRSAVEKSKLSGKFVIAPLYGSEVWITFEMLSGNASSKDAVERQIRDGRAAAIRALINVAGEGPVDPKVSGGFCRSVVLLGEIRATEAVDMLCKYLDFIPEDSAKFPASDYGDNGKYVAAVALVRVGSSARESIGRIANDSREGEERRRIAKWIIQQIDKGSGREGEKK